jgi:hypothetical protein
VNLGRKSAALKNPVLVQHHRRRIELRQLRFRELAQAIRSPPAARGPARAAIAIVTLCRKVLVETQS